MKDDNFWKDRYKDSWDAAAEKEEKIRKIVERECKCECEYVGLGAGTTEYLPGTAKSRGYKKGGSDLHVKGTNIFIEVTGPNIERVGKDDPLWIRPDKIQNAIDHPKNDYWVVHVLKKDFYIRSIHMTEEFKKDFQKGIIKIVHPTIRFTEETYAEVPANSKYVDEIDPMLVAIRKTLGKQ